MSRDMLQLDLRLVELSEFVKATRENLGLGRTEFAHLLGLNSAGERTVRGWENGEHKPTPKKIDDIKALESRLEETFANAPYAINPDNNYKFSFIDLFAGIGGIRLPFQELGGRCVFTSEWDKFAQKTYAANFGEVPKGDITEISAAEIPSHDILLAGFPCQAFSQAGLKQGFNDTRGTMFFEIQRILCEKRPKAFLLENVKQLKGHDTGRTLLTIMDVLTGQSGKIPGKVKMSTEARKSLSQRLNYWVDYKVLRSSDFGIPQGRERVYIVGFNKDYFGNIEFDRFFNWPESLGVPTCVQQILKESPSEIDPKYTISKKLLDGHKRRLIEHRKKGNGFGFSVFKACDPYTNTISARYYKDGSEILINQDHLGKRPRKLTPKECARLQGFPEKFIVNAVSDAQIYRQFGNSVTVNVVRAVAEKMMAFSTAAELLVKKRKSVKALPET